MLTGKTGAATSQQAQSGFAYLLVLMLIALIGMGLGAAGNVWRTDAQRDREAELLFIGDQYRLAIKSYYELDPAQPRLPTSVDQLLEDTRRLNPVRHLRRPYRDPMTQGEFIFVTSIDPAGIAGVHSRSTATPFKQSGFASPYQDFSQAGAYADWRFVFTPPAPAVPEGASPFPPPAPPEP